MSTPAQVWNYRTLIGNLAVRDLKSRYKKSVLGWSWSLINPAVSLGVYSVVFGVFLGGVAPCGRRLAGGSVFCARERRTQRDPAQPSAVAQGCAQRRLGRPTPVVDSARQLAMMKDEPRRQRWA